MMQSPKICMKASCRDKLGQCPLAMKELPVSVEIKRAVRSFLPVHSPFVYYACLLKKVLDQFAAASWGQI